MALYFPKIRKYTSFPDYCKNKVEISFGKIKCYLILLFFNKFGTIKCHYEVKVIMLCLPDMVHALLAQWTDECAVHVLGLAAVTLLVERSAHPVVVLVQVAPERVVVGGVVSPAVPLPLLAALAHPAREEARLEPPVRTVEQVEVLQQVDAVARDHVGVDVSHVGAGELFAADLKSGSHYYFQ